MNRRGVGALFCLISALLFITRYVCAAIFASGVTSWDETMFSNMLQYVGQTLPVLSIISLIIGVLYLISAEAKKE